MWTGVQCKKSQKNDSTNLSSYVLSRRPDLFQDHRCEHHQMSLTWPLQSELLFAKRSEYSADRSKQYTQQVFTRLIKCPLWMPSMRALPNTSLPRNRPYLRESLSPKKTPFLSIKVFLTSCTQTSGPSQMKFQHRSELSYHLFFGKHTLRQSDTTINQWQRCSQ